MMKQHKPILMMSLLLALSFRIDGFQSASDKVLDDINKINQEIKLQGLNWQAGITSLSSLSLEEKKLRLGGFVPLYEEPDQYVPIEDKAALPASWDWRDRNGRDYMTTVKNQGSCGSCWAYSATGVAESMHNVEKNIFTARPASAGPSKETAERSSGLFPAGGRMISGIRILALETPDLSEQDLVSCSSAGNCAGGWTSLAFDYMKSRGVVSEKCFPYQNKDASCRLCSDWTKHLTKIKGWGYVTQPVANNTKVKTALQDGPLSFWMEVFDDFYNYKSGIYEKTAGASYVGGHLVVLVGYNENENYWICKNSWGTDWGEDGYFKIRVGQCGGGLWISKAWGISISNKPPVLDPLSDQNVKEGKGLSFQLTASDPDGDELSFRASPLPEGASIDSSTGEFEWTPSYVQSGEYLVTFTVTDGIFEVSDRIKITVINIKKGVGRF